LRALALHLVGWAEQVAAVERADLHPLERPPYLRLHRREADIFGEDAKEMLHLDRSLVLDAERLQRSLDAGLHLGVRHADLGEREHSLARRTDREHVEPGPF